MKQRRLKKTCFAWNFQELKEGTKTEENANLNKVGFKYACASFTVKPPLSEWRSKEKKYFS